MNKSSREKENTIIKPIGHSSATTFMFYVAKCIIIFHSQ